MDGYDSGYDSDHEFDMADVIAGDHDDVPLDVLVRGLWSVNNSFYIPYCTKNIYSFLSFPL